MAKKDKSILGSIIKGTVDVAGEIIKTGYDAATSKTAKKFYKGTAELTKDAIKGTYDAVTSESAKKIYKKTGDAAVDLMRFTPPKEKLDKVYKNFKEKKLKPGLMYFLWEEEEHIKDTYNSLLKNHLNTDYNEKQYSKFRTHWRAICTQIVFGGFAKKSAADYFEMKSYLEEELNKKDPEIMPLVNEFYSNAYATGGLDTPRILNSNCFNNKLSEEAMDEFNRGFAFIHEMIIEGLK
mgnify:CR=1 FL=1